MKMDFFKINAKNGGGFSLGFKFGGNLRISSHILNHDEKSPILRKVIYEKREQKELVKKYLEGIIKVVRNKFSTKSENSEFSIQAPIMSHQASNILLDMLMTFKNKAFKEEKEWRLIHITREDFQPESLRFREDGNYLIPFRVMFLFNKFKDSKEEFWTVAPRHFI